MSLGNNNDKRTQRLAINVTQMLTDLQKNGKNR